MAAPLTPPAAVQRVATTLVTGATGAAREAAIAACLAPGVASSVASGAGGASGPCAVLLEGLPSGQAVLDPSPTILISRIAPGCLCCTGNLVLRVTLNRILRHRPERLFIGLATMDHLDQLRSWLEQPPYDQLLALTPDLRT